MSTPDGLPPLRDVIARLRLSARKSLGQNFLLDLNLTRRIARAGAPLDTTTVVEIGPGPGGLTRALLAEGAAHVIAIERDRRCIPALQEIAEPLSGETGGNRRRCPGAGLCAALVEGAMPRHGQPALWHCNRAFDALGRGG